MQGVKLIFHGLEPLETCECLVYRSGLGQIKE